MPPGCPKQDCQHVVLLLLLTLLLAVSLPPGAGLPSQACEPMCATLQQLPLQRWTEESTETSYELPWGQVYPFSALDYSSITKQLCECLKLNGEEPEEPAEAFVTRNGTHFIVDGRPLYFFGFNHPGLVRYAASNDSAQQQYLDALLERAVKLGMTVGRTWAHYDGYDVRPPDAGGDPYPFISLQMEPGHYNETSFKAMDALLVRARELGLLIILSLSDFTGALGTGKGGFEPHLAWVARSFNITGLTTLDFFTDERVRLLFKANLCAMANRVNHLTGVKYKHDPTIFAWEVMNEPACTACPGPTPDEVLYRWIEEMTAWMKCIAPHQMVSVGESGNFGASTPWRLTDTPGPWAICFGEDYSRFVALPTMDYGVAHMWPNNRGSWNDSGREPCGVEDCLVTWYRDWIASHINESTYSLHKPFVLEEFGLAYDEARRNRMFAIVRDVFREARAADPESAAAGAMFWLPALAGEPNTDGLNVYLDNSTAPFPVESQYGATRSAQTQQWLDTVREMEESVRREELKEHCMTQAKYEYRAVWDNQAVKMYSSNSTAALLSGAASELSALGPGLVVEGLLRPKAGALAAATEALEPELDCPACLFEEELPLQQWAAEEGGRVATELPWGQAVLFPEVDYAGAAQAACGCLAEGQEESPSAALAGQFVERHGTQFVLAGRPFYFVGFNAWQLPQLFYNNRSAAAESLLARAAELGFQVGRVFVPGNGPDTRLPSQRAMVDPLLGNWTSLQTQPGSFNEAAFQALDRVIAEAASNGIKLILVLGSQDSNLGYGGPGTPLQYMQWVTGTYNVTGRATVQDFFTDERARLLFKSFLCALAGRVNSVTGRRYSSDPTIMAWELLEAPRCPGCTGNATGEVLTAWADEMSRFLKCAAPRQLVSLAQQGLYGPEPAERLTTNPSLGTYCAGADFVELSSLPAVDYATMQIHESLKQYNEVGPENCGWACHLRFFSEWLQAHLNDTAALVGKPLVIDEVGKSYHEDKRNQLFGLVKGALLGSIGSDPLSPAAGFLFTAANVGGQPDWGASVYLDGSLPSPGPERYEALREPEASWMLAVDQLQRSFERREAAADCAAAALARYSGVYNTTALKVFNSSTTVGLVQELAQDAARASAGAGA